MPMKAVPANTGVPETGSPSWDAPSVPSEDFAATSYAADFAAADFAAADDASSFLAEYESLSVRLSDAKALLEALLRTEEAREDDSEVAPSRCRSRRRRGGRSRSSSCGEQRPVVVVGEGADGEEEEERERPRRKRTRTDRSSRLSSKSCQDGDQDERCTAASAMKRRRRSGACGAAAGGRTGYAGDVSDHGEITEPSSRLCDESGSEVASTLNSTTSAAVSEKRAGECETVVNGTQGTKKNSLSGDGNDEDEGDDFLPRRLQPNGIFLNVPKRRKARRRSGDGNGKIRGKEASASALRSQGSQQLLRGNGNADVPPSRRAASFVHPEIDLSLVKHVVVPAGSLWSPSSPSPWQSCAANTKVDEARRNVLSSKTEAHENAGSRCTERRGNQVQLSHPVQLGEALAFSDRARLIVEADPPHNVAHFNAAYQSLASSRRNSSSSKGKAAAPGAEAATPCVVGRPLLPAADDELSSSPSATGGGERILDLVAQRVTSEDLGGEGAAASAASVAVHPILSDVPPQQRRTARLFGGPSFSYRRGSDGTALDDGGNCGGIDGGTKSTHYLVEIFPAATAAAGEDNGAPRKEASRVEEEDEMMNTTMTPECDRPMMAVHAVG